jgi:hypothetical protein
MKLHPPTRLKARTNFFARGCGFALLLPSLVACVVPIPSNLAGPYTYKEVPDSVIRAIEPQATTRADILLQLSEPWIRGPADGYFVYSWLEYLGGVTALIITPIPVGGPVYEEFKCLCLVIQFGDDGRVERRVVLSDAGGAQNMSRYPCPDERMKEAIQVWLAQSPARP